MTETRPVAPLFGEQLGNTHRAVRALFNDVLGANATTFDRWVVLRMLARHGSAMRGADLRRDLAEGLETDSSSVAKLVQRVEVDGLIRETAAPGEPEATLVELTSEGEAIHQRLSEAAQGTGDRLLGGLDPDDLQTTLRVLGQVHERAGTLRTA